MVCKLKVFGIARDILGGKDVHLQIPGSRVADLKKALSLKYPELDKLNSLFIAVNLKYADDSAELKESDEIALIPPVSGG